MKGPSAGPAPVVVGVLALALAACSSGTSPTPGPSSTPSPTASPSATEATSSPDAPFDRRDPNLTDGASLARLATPTTGEVWFDAPRKIATPPWAVGDEYLDQDWTSWYEIGTRDGNTIVVFEADYVSDVFERDPSGTYQWIPFPSARDDVTSTAGSYGYESVAANTTIYYDSLTLPSTFSLPGGEPLTVQPRDYGSVLVPGQTVSSVDGVVVDRIGGYDLVRVTNPVRWIWSDVYDVTAPTGLTYEDLFYVLVTPYGMYTPLVYSPVSALNTITWSIPTSLTADADRVYLADLNDVGCGTRDSDHNTIVQGTVAADWTLAGTTAEGVKVYVPSDMNPLVEPMYAVYQQFSDLWGTTPVSLSLFVDAPALIAFRSIDTGEWIVDLNGAYSGRQWC